MDADGRKCLESLDYPAPLDLGMLEVDEQGQVQAGGRQVIDALGQVFAGQAMGTLELDEEAIVHHQVGDVLADGVTFIDDAVGDLGRGGDASKRELLDERTLVDLFQKAGSQDVGNFVGGTDDGFEEGVQRFAAVHVILVVAEAVKSQN
jgi:hypothetical protein